MYGKNVAKGKIKNKDNGKDTGLMHFNQVLLKLSCCLEFLHLGEEGGGVLKVVLILGLLKSTLIYQPPLL